MARDFGGSSLVNFFRFSVNKSLPIGRYFMWIMFKDLHLEMKKFWKIGLNIVLLFLFQESSAQLKHWVEFTDKGPTVSSELAYVSAKTYQQRAMLGLPVRQPTDIPLYGGYMEALQAVGVTPLVASKWLNAVSARLTPEQVHQLQSFPFIKAIQIMPGETVLASEVTPPLDDPKTWEGNLVDALRQVHAESFFEAGLTGKGVAVGILDAGFIDADSSIYLGPLVANGQVLGWRDWVNPDREDIFRSRETGMDWHGTGVWQMVAGWDTTTNMYSGLAPDASFYLARTEHGTNEYRGEQDNWIAALEWLDSLGVRLVNCSLGYSYGFDDPEENYLPEEMDGRTKIAKAVQLAAEEKGMILVISQGNEGNDLTWQYLSTPAEAPGVISVGATNFRVWTRAGYSGKGPDFLEVVKPDVSVYSTSGTSFSAPVVAGIVAGMLQQDSTLLPAQVQAYLQASGHSVALPNNYVGYGVPDCGKLLVMMQQPIDSIAWPECATVDVSDLDGLEFKLVLADYGFDGETSLARYHLKADRRTVLAERAYAPGMLTETLFLSRSKAEIAYSALVSQTGTCALLTWPQIETESEEGN
ncbi:MAG TPA: peptidase S8 [Cytophagales bacterium]|nr:peptidase S8 [Cytophagales bacterium]